MAPRTCQTRTVPFKKQEMNRSKVSVYIKTNHLAPTFINLEIEKTLKNR